MSTPFVLGEMVTTLHMRVSGMPCCGQRRRITRWEECRANFGTAGLTLWNCPCGAEFTSDDWVGDGIATTVFMDTEETNDV